MERIIPQQIWDEEFKYIPVYGKKPLINWGNTELLLDNLSMVILLELRKLRGVYSRLLNLDKEREGQGFAFFREAILRTELIDLLLKEYSKDEIERAVKKAFDTWRLILPKLKKYHDQYKLTSYPEITGYGLYIGEDYFIIDIDDPKKGKNLIEYLEEKLNTFVVRTGRGFHHYFKLDEEGKKFLGNFSKYVSESHGFEIRRGKHYILGAGSLHPTNEEGYKVENPLVIRTITKEELKEFFNAFHIKKSFSQKIEREDFDGYTEEFSITLDKNKKEEIIKLISPYWNEGVRHELARHLANFFRRRRVSVNDALDIILKIAQGNKDEKELGDRKNIVVYQYMQPIDKIERNDTIKNELRKCLMLGSKDKKPKSWKEIDKVVNTLFKLFKKEYRSWREIPYRKKEYIIVEELIRDIEYRQKTYYIYKGRYAKKGWKRGVIILSEMELEISKIKLPLSSTEKDIKLFIKILEDLRNKDIVEFNNIIKIIEGFIKTFNGSLPKDLKAYFEDLKREDKILNKEVYLTKLKEKISLYKLFKKVVPTFRIEDYKPDPEDMIEDISEVIDVALTEGYIVERDIVLISKLHSFKTSTNDNHDLMAWQPHSIVITNTKAGKTTTFQNAGAEGGESINTTPANLLGYSTAQESYEGSLSEIPTSFLFDEFQDLIEGENKRSVLKSLLNILEKGKTTIRKGMREVITEYNNSIIFVANPKPTIKKDYFQYQDERDLIVEKTARLLSALSENANALGSRIGVFYYNPELKPAIESKTKGELTKEEIEKARDIFNQIKNELSKIFEDLITLGFGREIRDSAEKVLEGFWKFLEEKSKKIYDEYFYTFIKGLERAERRLIGGAIKLALQDPYIISLVLHKKHIEDKEGFLEVLKEVVLEKTLPEIIRLNKESLDRLTNDYKKRGLDVFIDKIEEFIRNLRRINKKRLIYFLVKYFDVNKKEVLKNKKLELITEGERRSYLKPSENCLKEVEEIYNKYLKKGFEDKYFSSFLPSYNLFGYLDSKDSYKINKFLEEGGLSIQKGIKKIVIKVKEITIWEFYSQILEEFLEPFTYKLEDPINIPYFLAKYLIIYNKFIKREKNEEGSIFVDKKLFVNFTHKISKIEKMQIEEGLKLLEDEGVINVDFDEETEKVFILTNIEDLNKFLSKENERGEI